MKTRSPLKGFADKVLVAVIGLALFASLFGVEVVTLRHYGNGWLGCGMSLVEMAVVGLCWLGLARLFKWPAHKYRKAARPDTKPEPPAV